MVAQVSAHRLADLLGQRGADTTAYGWLADGIHTLVADGRLLHGTRLPSERELLGALGVSRTTVTRAYSVLVDRGYAEARRGSGTVVQLPGGTVDGGGEPLADLAREGEGRGLLDLRRAAPPAPNGLRRALDSALERLPSYVCGAGYFPLGVPELRERVAARYTERGVPTAPDQILITPGAYAALAAVLQTVLGRGDRIVVETPTYPNSVATLRHGGVRMVPVPIHVDGPDLEARDQALASGPAAMLSLPDFHNPTGVLLDDAQRDALAHGWKRSGVVGVVDETAAEVWLDRPPEVLPMAAHSPGCVSVGSASKTFWGGLRIGWIRAPRTLVAPIAATRLRLDLGVPVFEQLVAADLMRERPSLCADSRERLIAGRAVLLGLQEALPQWEVRVPSGGLSLWWRMPLPRSTRLVAAARALGILLDPGSTYAVQGRGLEHHLRTPYTLPASTLERAVPLMAQAWQDVA